MRSLGLVFFLSGFAALVYQVVWQRLLTLHYGVGTVSITLIVTVYMAGLGVGSLAGGYVAERRRALFRLYALIEVLIGLFGLLSLPFLAALGKWTAGASHVWALGWMSLFLCIPTFLMGSTLPLLAKAANRVAHDYLATISFLYFANTIGAAVGALAASYVVISLIGLDGGIYTAVAINLFLAWRIARLAAASEEAAPARGESPVAAPLERAPRVVAVATGFLAIGYQIVWFRLVGTLVKASPYAFSTTLAVYLLGIALGSYGMHLVARRRPRLASRSTFFALQVAIAASVAAGVIGFDALTRHTPAAALAERSFATLLHPPHLDWILRYFGPGAVYATLDIVLWSVWFTLVPTLMMGASLPLLSALALGDSQREGHVTGVVYAYTIAGNVLGGLVTGLVLLPALGTERALALYVSLGALFALGVERAGARRLPTAARVLAAAALGAVALLGMPSRGELYRLLHTLPEAGRAGAPPGDPASYAELVHEGADAVIVTFVDGERVFNYINGLPHGGRGYHFGFRYEVLEAASHVSALDEVLVIGYGTGEGTRAVLELEGVGRVTVVELNRDLMANLERLPAIRAELADPRLRFVFDDGRRFLHRDESLYDLVLIDPLRSTTAYSNNLYSREFYELVRSRMQPEGVFKVWLDERDVMPKTVLAAFPHVLTYASFCIASPSPLARRADRVAEARRSLDDDERAWMASFEGQTPEDEVALAARTRGLPINRDWRPICEYYLGYDLRRWWRSLRAQ